jgi:hypothetical protein
MTRGYGFGFLVFFIVITLLFVAYKSHTYENPCEEIQGCEKFNCQSQEGSVFSKNLQQTRYQNCLLKIIVDHNH